MRKVTLGGLFVFSVSALVACGGDDLGGFRRGPAPAATDPEVVTPETQGPAANPSAPACSGVADPIAVAVNAGATDVRFVRDEVYFRDGLQVSRVKKDGTGRADVYASNDLVRSFADEDVLVTIESPNAPDAVLKLMPVTGAGAGPLDLKPIAQTVATNWTAAGSYVFASDKTSLYVMADVANQGDSIYRVEKQNLQNMTLLAALQAPITDPQLAGSDVWFVRDQKRVYRIAQAAYDPTLEERPTPQPATEVFGIGYADCKLAVSSKHAFCSTGKALEQRDLSGGNLKTVLDGAAVLGSAITASDQVLVRSLPSSPTDALKHGIRAVKADGTSTVVACGRETIEAIAADASSVVWAEKGKGVFVAPR
ncbi:MAG: hypothetical protein KF819_07405 [Labilithrix sp.]|nr:hypothetical protein [Labilithrix sp.]